MSIEVIKFKSYERNTLRGFFTCRMTGVGLELRDLTLHEKDGKRWIGLPAKPYEKDGGQAWSHIVKFYDEARSKQFQTATLKALDGYLKKHGAKEESPAANGALHFSEGR